MPIMLFLILILIFVILLVVVTNIVIVPQSMVYVVERLGSYSETWSAGLHVKIPFLERVAKKVSLKEQVADFPPQPVITRDNVTMQIDTVVFVAVSTLCLLALKPLCARLRRPPAATNGDRALGREATVLTPVSAETTGRVRLDGVDWNARCATPGDTLTPGQSCRVAEIHSTLLIVEPILTETAAPAAH